MVNWFLGNSKRSQLSIVIVIVLVIIAVGFIIFFSSSVNIKSPDKTDTSGVDSFVQNCLSTAVNNGFLLSMRQSGNIFQAQGGYAHDFSAINFDMTYSSYIVPYLIRGFDDSSFFVYNDYNKERHLALNSKNIIFGFPFSCKNYPDSSSPSGSYYYPAFNSSINSGHGVFFNFANCTNDDLYLSPVPAQYILPSFFRQNAEKNLEAYVNSNFMKCINGFNSFKNQYDISYGKHNLSILLTNNTVVANLNFPITIKKFSGSSKWSLVNFSYKINGLRIYSLLDFVNSVLLKISSNASFSLDNAHYDGFKVLTVKNVDQKGDILTKVIDTKSYVKGKPLEFWFAERVRPPLIHFFPSQVAIFGPTGLINQTKNTHYSFKPYYDYMKCCCSSMNQGSSSLCNSVSCSNHKYNCKTVLEYFFNNTLTRHNGFSFFNATDLNGYPVTISTNFTSVSDYTDFLKSGILNIKVNATNSFASSERTFKLILQ